MCEKTEEIQESWNPIEGDRYFSHWNQRYFMIHWRNVDKTCTCWKNKLTWLPRQDQLQELYCTEYPVTLECFIQFTKDSGKYWEQFKSMEQLWLAFIMKEKYKKTWNGKEWLK